MPHFVITPAALTWSPLFAGYYAYLGGQVSFYRVRTGYMLGTGANNAVKAGRYQEAEVKTAKEHHEAEQRLQIARSAHSNFAENVPFSMGLMLIAEINGAPTWLMHAAYASLFAARVAHVELGLKRQDSVGLGRLLGYYWNLLGINLGFGAYNFALGYDALKTFIFLTWNHGLFLR